jgi:tetratricopeptide (TPR) repeat protein
MPLSFLLAGDASAVAMTATLVAQPVETAAAADGQGETDELFDAFLKQFYGGRYADALATAERIKVDEDNKQGRATIKAMRAAALVGLKRNKEALKLFAEADAAAPTIVLINTLQYEAGLRTNNFEIAAAALDRMISRTPDAVRNLGMDGVAYLLRNEPEGQEKQNEDRRVALGQLGYGGATGDYYTAGAVDILLRRGEVAKAAELVSFIDDPATIESYLIGKRYAALWPTLEATVGDHLNNRRKSSVREARKEFEDNPDNTEKREFLIGALWHAGQLDEAIAFRSELPGTAAALSTANSDTGWAFNNVASALHEAGRKEEADQLFAFLNEAEINGSGWWRVNMIINRVQLLVADGKFDRAMSLMSKVETSANVDGNARSQQIVRKLKYCTLSQLGQKDEAASLLPELLRHAEDAPGPTINALVCAGKIDEAEKLTLASLKDEDFERYFVRSLQVNPLTGDYPSVWDKSWQDLRRRPAIAKEFERLGRDMPAKFLPPGRPQANAPAQAPADTAATAKH